jgi:hypothetical protein
VYVCGLVYLRTFKFVLQLSALYEVKPPISKAKMTSITRGAIKAIKFYKHVVQSVEKFIQKVKCVAVMFFHDIVRCTKASRDTVNVMFR